MLTILVLFAALDSATPAPTPVVRADSGSARTLADVARERKLGVKKAGGFSAAGSTVAAPASALTDQDRHVLQYGEPTKRNVTTTLKGTSEQWVYPWGYIYFREGRLVAVQNR